MSDIYSYYLNLDVSNRFSVLILFLIGVFLLISIVLLTITKKIKEKD